MLLLNVRGMHQQFDDFIEANETANPSSEETEKPSVSEDPLLSNTTQKFMSDTMTDLRNNGYPVALMDYDLCFTFRHWKNELLGPTVVLLVLRHPLQVAKAVNEDRGIPIAEALALWEWEMLSAMHEIEGMAVLVISIDDLATDITKNLETLRKVSLVLTNPFISFFLSLC